MKNSLISVIVPVYNVESYLVQCLDSILAQTYQNLEIILVDDGSTDGCSQICNTYGEKDSRVVVFHSENRGLASARNLGLEYAKGDYISYIDSDDWIELNTMEELLNASVQFNADIVVGMRSTEYIGQSRTSQNNERQAQVFYEQDILTAFVNGLFGDVMWNKLYRRECFRDIRFPDGHNYEDVATTWKIMKTIAKRNGIIVVLPETFFHFRMRKSSISHTGSFDNIVDAWMAYYKKYEELVDYQDKLLPSCLMVTGKMWRKYISFSKAEKKEAAAVVTEMQEFSKKHFWQVIRGNYSLLCKMICTASLFRNSLVMHISGYMDKLYSGMRNEKERMFD